MRYTYSKKTNTMCSYIRIYPCRNISTITVARHQRTATKISCCVLWQCQRCAWLPIPPVVLPSGWSVPRSVYRLCPNRCIDCVGYRAFHRRQEVWSRRSVLVCGGVIQMELGPSTCGVTAGKWWRWDEPQHSIPAKICVQSSKTVRYLTHRKIMQLQQFVWLSKKFIIMYQS